MDCGLITRERQAKMPSLGVLSTRKISGARKKTARFGSIDLANRFADRCKNCDMSVACCDVAKAATYEWTSTISHASLESYDSQGDCEACMASVPCSWNCDSRNNAVNAAKPSGIFGVVLSSVLLATTAMM